LTDGSHEINELVSTHYCGCGKKERTSQRAYHEFVGSFIKPTGSLKIFKNLLEVEVILIFKNFKNLELPTGYKL
jgi:hypothetical protein